MKTKHDLTDESSPAEFMRLHQHHHDSLNEVLDRHLGPLLVDGRPVVLGYAYTATDVLGRLYTPDGVWNAMSRSAELERLQRVSRAAK